MGQTASLTTALTMAVGLAGSAGMVMAQDRDLPDFGGDSDLQQSQLAQSYEIADYLNPVCADLSVSRRDCEIAAMDVAIAIKDRALRDFRRGAEADATSPVMGIFQGMAAAGTESLLNRICTPVPEDSSDVEVTLHVQGNGRTCLAETQSMLFATRQPNTFSVITPSTIFMASEYLNCLQTDETDCAVYMSSDEDYATTLERPRASVYLDYLRQPENCGSIDTPQGAANCVQALVNITTSTYTYAAEVLDADTPLRGDYAVQAGINDYQVFFDGLGERMETAMSQGTLTALAPVISYLENGPFALERLQQKTGIEFPEGTLGLLSNPSEAIPGLEQHLLEQ